MKTTITRTKFVLYVAWRILRLLFIWVTVPIWVPVVLLVLGVGALLQELLEGSAAWFTEVRDDFEAKSARRLADRQEDC